MKDEEVGSDLDQAAPHSCTVGALHNGVWL